MSDNVVKELRQSCGLSQSQFAKYMGVSVRRIQCWEQGVRQPDEAVVGLMRRVIELESGKGSADLDMRDVVSWFFSLEAADRLDFLGKIGAVRTRMR